MTDRYEPDVYWSDRLSEQFDKRGTGHLSYSHQYNEWLYRAKRRALRRALRDVTPAGSVLDLGSGTGWVVQELSTAGMTVVGCDIAPVAVERLRARFPSARFFRTTLGAEPLDCEDGSQDAVTALDVLYHVVDDDAWLNALTEAKRVLRPGGLLIVSDGFGADDRTPSEHVRFRSRARWSAAASDVGLTLARLDAYFRWLSRDPQEGLMARHLPDGLRGAAEYALEQLIPRTPHMRLAVYARPATSA
jgi:SAM-dependent methyltransferase